METEVVRAYQELELRYQQAMRELTMLKESMTKQTTHPSTPLLGVVRCIKCGQLMEVVKP